MNRVNFVVIFFMIDKLWILNYYFVVCFEYFMLDFFIKNLCIVDFMNFMGFRVRLKFDVYFSFFFG